MNVPRRITLVFGWIGLALIARANATDYDGRDRTHTLPSLPIGNLGFKYSGPDPRAAISALERPAIEIAGSFGEPSQLPKMVVSARWGVPSENEMLTDYGRLQVAKERFTTPLYRATFGPLSQVATYYFNFLTILNGWHPNDAEAMTLYREAERAQILRDFDDLCRRELLQSPEAGDDLRRMRMGVWRTGIDSLYWDASPRTTGILIGVRKR